MTSKDAYLNDLNDIQAEIDRLLSMVPIGGSKKVAQARKQAEAAASAARATIGCMKNDYIISEPAW